MVSSSTAPTNLRRSLPRWQHFFCALTRATRARTRCSPCFHQQLHPFSLSLSLPPPPFLVSGFSLSFVLSNEGIKSKQLSVVIGVEKSCEEKRNRISQAGQRQQGRPPPPRPDQSVSPSLATSLGSAREVLPFDTLLLFCFAYQVLLRSASSAVKKPISTTRHTKDLDLRNCREILRLESPLLFEKSSLIQSVLTSCARQSRKL